MVRRLVIRADADLKRGTGHVMRMIALAQVWSDAGGEVLFVSNVAADALQDRIRREGFQLVRPNGPHPDSDDAAALLTMTDAEDRVVLDGYHFGTAYQLAIHAAGRVTLVMDDINDRVRYAASFLVNQNVDAAEYQYDVVPDCRILLGLKYALVRREFLEARRLQRDVPDKATRILVTFGGGDTGNRTEGVLRALGELGDASLHVKAVVGAVNPHAERLAIFAASLPYRCELFYAVEDMPVLMNWADLAVGASGGTCWELCLLGVPMVLFVAADNQAGIARGLADAGAALCPEGVSAYSLGAAINDACLRRRMSLAGRSLVDGKGARRLVEMLVS